MNKFYWVSLKSSSFVSSSLSYFYHLSFRTCTLACAYIRVQFRILFFRNSRAFSHTRLAEQLAGQGTRRRWPYTRQNRWNEITRGSSCERPRARARATHNRYFPAKYSLAAIPSRTTLRKTARRDGRAINYIIAFSRVRKSRSSRGHAARINRARRGRRAREATA